MREDYLRQAQKVIQDPNILINVVSLEDIALLEIIKGNIQYELYNPTKAEDL